MKKLYFDGYTIGKNPSYIGGGFTVCDENGKVVVEQEIKKAGMTNNEAELLGMLCSFNICHVGDRVSTDSQNLMSWMKKGRSKSRPDLNHIIQECQRKGAEKEIDLIWEPREVNLAGIYNEQKENEQHSRHP